MMTKRQRVHLCVHLWSDVCQARGWNVKDEARRHELYAQALGDVPRHAETLESGEPIRFSSFDNADFDAVKALFLSITRPASVNAQVNQINQPRRRLRYKLLCELAPCLAVYVEDAEAYTLAILRDKFTKGAVECPALEDLTEPQLRQLCMTLNRAINGSRGLRVKAGHSLHDMRTRAGLKCHCKHCETAKKHAGKPVQWGCTVHT